MSHEMCESTGSRQRFAGNRYNIVLVTSALIRRFLFSANVNHVGRITRRLVLELLYQLRSHQRVVEGDAVRVDVWLGGQWVPRLGDETRSAIEITINQV